MRVKIKKQIRRRLKIAEGQVRGLQKMVENGEYCVDILRQSSAVKEALSGVENALLENHLATHVIEQAKKRKTGTIINEMMAVYKLAKKK